jgi:hypothetical protein
MQHVELPQYDFSNHWPTIGMDFAVWTRLLHSGWPYCQPYLYLSGYILVCWRTDRHVHAHTIIFFRAQSNLRKIRSYWIFQGEKSSETAGRVFLLSSFDTGRAMNNESRGWRSGGEQPLGHEGQIKRKTCLRTTLYTILILFTYISLLIISCH